MTHRERAERFFDAELTSTGSSTSEWSARLKGHLADEFDAVAREAAEEMREQCRFIAVDTIAKRTRPDGTTRYEIGVEVDQAIRALPTNE